MTQQVVDVASRRLNLTATATIAGSGEMMGIWVSSASATPTIKVADSKGTLANTFTPVAATWYRLPFKFINGLTVTISGTVDCTVAYN